MTLAPADRNTPLDVVRGFAVLGILLLNIVGFAMPERAAFDPVVYGGTDGANRVVWALNYILAEGKMRGLFTILFGASTILIAERALASGKSPTRVHYARMFWLFVIGLGHAILIWIGDILTLYALWGAVVFLAWRWRARLLLVAGGALLLLSVADGLTRSAQLRSAQTAAARPTATAAEREEWARTQALFRPSPASIAQEVAAYRGDYADTLKERLDTSDYTPSTRDLLWMIETPALMLIGMALYRIGFFGEGWSSRRHRVIVLVGYALTIPPTVALAYWLSATGFSRIVANATEAVHLGILRPGMALAHASAIILLVRSRAAPWMADRLAAAGRMAFSNYLGTSLICTTLFYGYGFGLYGQLERWELYIVVAGVWATILLWSKPWLERYRYGPFEWLWRGLARGRPQRLR